MSTSPAVQTDPYLLPLPAPSSLVVLPHLVHAMHAHLNVRYAEPVWPLAPLTGNPTVAARTIYWRTCPAVFCDEIRLVAWNLINGRLRPTYLRQRGTRLRARLSMDAVHHAITEWIKLAQWLAEQDIRSLAHCGTNVLHDYAQRWRDSGIGRMHAQRNLAALTRLWAFDQLSAAPTGIGRPPWEDHGADDYLPAAT